MQVNRQELLACLTAITPGLAAVRETVEQSACFVFRKGMVMTYNGEIACTMQSPIKLKGAVTASPLVAILEKLTEEDVEIVAEGSELLIQGRGRRAGVLMEADITLPIEAVETPTVWHELPGDFSEAADLVAQCTGKDDSQGFYLRCVHITPKHMEACDNVQLIRYPLATGIETATMVKGEQIKHISGLGVTEISETETWLHFRNSAGLVFSCRKYENTDYPQLGKILKVEGTALALPQGIEEAVEKARIFSQGNQINDNVMVELRTDGLMITGASGIGWYKERRKVAYSGDPLKFMIAPKLLIEVTKRGNECEVAPQRLKVTGSKWIYVTVLGVPDTGVQQEPDETAE